MKLLNRATTKDNKTIYVYKQNNLYYNADDQTQTFKPEELIFE